MIIVGLSTNTTSTLINIITILKKYIQKKMRLSHLFLQTIKLLFVLISLLSYQNTYLKCKLLFSLIDNEYHFNMIISTFFSKSSNDY